MHYTSLTIYDKYWRLGYYDGIKMEDFYKWAPAHQETSYFDSGIWIWVEDSKLKWRKDWEGIPIPIIDTHATEDLCHGFMWATVPNKGTIYDWVDERKKKGKQL